MNRLGPRKLRQQVGKHGADAERDQAMTDDVMTEFTVEELREFLQGDILDVQVDPAFKERLKRRLWELVKEEARRRESTDDS
ncbi:MAG: hypothetical protein O7F10_05140 [Deltaproteobacteria bacterium]|nr:hypothetical protein [Deltaproteobacteria bacterium]